MFCVVAGPGGDEEEEQGQGAVRAQRSSPVRLRRHSLRGTINILMYFSRSRIARAQGIHMHHTPSRHTQYHPSASAGGVSWPGEEGWDGRSDDRMPLDAECRRQVEKHERCRSRSEGSDDASFVKRTTVLRVAPARLRSLASLCRHPILSNGREIEMLTYL